MDKEIIGHKLACKYIKEALIFIGYPENICIKVKISADGNACFEGSYQILINGVLSTVILPLSDKNSEEMLRYGIELSGKEIVYLNKRLNNNKLTYTLGYKGLIVENRLLKKERIGVLNAWNWIEI